MAKRKKQRQKRKAGGKTAPRVATHPPIFIGGAGRSGTTLLRVILDAHPHIACGPELKMLSPLAKQAREMETHFGPVLREWLLEPADVLRLHADFMSGLMEKYRLHTGKRRVAEKTPGNVLGFPDLHRVFPNSPLIHIIRDGRDVVCSLLTMNWVEPDGRPAEFTRDVRKAAEYWVEWVQAGRGVGRNPALSRQYHELRYEQLVREPEAALRPLFAFLHEPWDPRVLRFHEVDRNLGRESSAAQVTQPIYHTALGRWRRDLSPTQQAVVKEVAGPLLGELGYTPDENW